MKRAISVWLVLCMMICLLPFSAMAADAEPTFTARVNNGSSYLWSTAMTPGAATRYAITDAEGNVKEATEADAWNLKLEYPADGTPMVTCVAQPLRPARIVSPCRSAALHPVS